MQDPQDPKSKKIDLRAKASWVFSPDATLAIGLRPDFEGMRQTIKENYGAPEDDKAWFAVMKKYGVDAKALPKEYKVTPDATTAMIADELLLRAVDRMETDYLYGRRGAEMTVESKPDTLLPLPFMGTKAQRAVMDQYGAFLNPNNKLRFVQNEEFAMRVPGELADAHPPTRLMDELTSEKVRMAYGEALDEWKLEYTPRGRPLQRDSKLESGGFADEQNKFINVVHRYGPEQTSRSVIHETQHAIQSTQNELPSFFERDILDSSLTLPQIAHNAVQQGRNPFVLTNEESSPDDLNLRRDDTLPSTLSYLAAPISEQDILRLEQNRRQRTELENQLKVLYRQQNAIENDPSLPLLRRAEKANEMYDEIRPLNNKLFELNREASQLERQDFDVNKLFELENFQYRNSANQIVPSDFPVTQLTGLGLMYGRTKPTPEQILSVLMYENSWHEREARFAENSPWDYYAPGDRFGTLSRQLLQRR
jgi:hypothetical protein